VVVDGIGHDQPGPGHERPHPDDPKFIDLVHAFVANPAHNVRCTSYFSYPGSIDSDITQFPKAEAEFMKDFGG